MAQIMEVMDELIDDRIDRDEAYTRIGNILERFRREVEISAKGSIEDRLDAIERVLAANIPASALYYKNDSGVFVPLVKQVSSNG